MSLRENRFFLGILIPLFYEVGLIQAYLLFMADRFESFLLLPIFLLAFPAFILYIGSPYLILRITRAPEQYKAVLGQNIDKIFFLKKIDLEKETKEELKTSIHKELLPELIKVFRRGYIDSYFTRNDDIPVERMLSMREALFLLAITFGILNLLNVITVVYLHFGSIDLDFLFIDQIVNPINVIFFAGLFGFFVILSLTLFFHSKRNLGNLIGICSYNLSQEAYTHDIAIRTRQIELDSVRRFPLDDKIGHKLAANWDLVARLYYEFIESHINEEMRDYARQEVARTLVLEQYSKMLNRLDLPEEKKKELELQFYLGQGMTEAISEIVDSEEETESIKLDVLYANKKLETWEDIGNDERVSTFLFSWRSTETLFRQLLWQRKAYPTDDPTWPAIVNSLLREKLLTMNENKQLKQIRLRRNAMLHRSQDRFVSKEDMENLLTILQKVLDRV
ncbi:MAG: hypothetical protein ACFFFG_09295 [Candidatus Thorarchaeota archaeon]